MEQHLNVVHSEYAHPGKWIGLPLPSNVVSAVLVDPREETKFAVPLRPSFTLIRAVQESAERTSAREKRASSNATAAASVNKRTRTK